MGRKIFLPQVKMLKEDDFTWEGCWKNSSYVPQGQNFSYLRKKRWKRTISLEKVARTILLQPVLRLEDVMNEKTINILVRTCYIIRTSVRTRMIDGKRSNKSNQMCIWENMKLGKSSSNTTPIWMNLGIARGEETLHATPHLHRAKM